ncbi:conserved hypothetical protein [Coccidioides posadasii str. Silveira]|uniref:Uncharacterized protein n=2 Tax=Coccidioides posadasii TaxID=199306 RepID=E9CR20_COCPS|nr:conserved hypothetical protein [Coccidioides posadasii str. Silveira]KMM64097.1 hypothetical protein CPAG_00449 [Coccidioides posadasii RMSCC 3488]
MQRRQQMRGDRTTKGKEEVTEFEPGCVLAEKYIVLDMHNLQLAPFRHGPRSLAVREIRIRTTIILWTGGEVQDPQSGERANEGGLWVQRIPESALRLRVTGWLGPRDLTMDEADCKQVMCKVASAMRYGVRT